MCGCLSANLLLTLHTLLTPLMKDNCLLSLVKQHSHTAYSNSTHTHTHTHTLIISTPLSFELMCVHTADRKVNQYPTAVQFGDTEDSVVHTVRSAALCQQITVQQLLYLPIYNQLVHVYTCIWYSLLILEVTSLHWACVCYYLYYT